MAGKTKTESYTYEKAGVSIDAGNRLVKAIGPLVKATARPGADADIGGFGGFFDPKAAGYNDPLLVAANDGVGTKIKLAIDHDRHGQIGIEGTGEHAETEEGATLVVVEQRHRGVDGGPHAVVS